MIQLQMLNYMLKNGKSDLFSLYDEKYFPTYEKEYNFAKKHLAKYKKLPDIPTFLEKFPEFNVIDVAESEQYLQESLFEEYLYNHSVDILTKGQEMFDKDSRAAVHYMLNNLPVQPPTHNYGVDIIKSAKDRYDKYLEKAGAESKEKYIFSTGLPELDLVINGLQRGEELVVIYARTNNAKSWIAEKFATAIWEAGGNVGFFEPEMSADSIGYRFDTLFKNINNNGVLGNSPEFNPDKYKTYINALTKHTNIFDVTTPVDFDKKTTVSKLRQWVIDRKLDALFIDGISYLFDERSDNKASTTDRLTNISEDLMTLSIELSIPIVIVVQANRTAARDNEGEVNNDTPELDTIRNSDGISHNVSKALAVRLNGNLLTIKVTKHRNGVVGNKLQWNYDINVGKFTYLPNPNANLPEHENEVIAEEHRNMYNDSKELL